MRVWVWVGGCVWCLCFVGECAVGSRLVHIVAVTYPLQSGPRWRRSFEAVIAFSRSLTGSVDWKHARMPHMVPWVPVLARLVG